VSGATVVNGCFFLTTPDLALVGRDRRDLYPRVLDPLMTFLSICSAALDAQDVVEHDPKSCTWAHLPLKS